MSLVVYNTLSGKKEEFKPLTDGKVGIYGCGVTTYDDCHIGHALQAVYFDVIRNYFEFIGYDVNYVRNYTDVDDKIIARAAERKMSPIDLASQMIASSERDMQAIGCREPTHKPRVSEMIPQIITMIEELIKRGGAYATNGGDVYYRVRAKKDYGKLSNRSVDELRSGTRDIVEGDKEDELDFALWKKDTTEGASWDSPWGVGRPGWHIECSVMSREFLGNTFDIHGGGRDLVFPHHENEIAQSESANEAPYATYWMHCGLLTIEHQKMSKSIGNQITIADFLEKWPAEVLRLAFLQNHYRSNIDFKKDTFLIAHKRLYYYYQTLAALDDLAAKASDAAELKDLDEAFITAMNDDFNSAAALAEINKGFKAANELLTTKKSAEKFNQAKAYARAFRRLGQVFGLFAASPQTALETLRTMILPELGVSKDEISKKIAERKSARESKDYAAGDKIRDELAVKGIELKDTPTGTDWCIKYDE